MALRIDTQGRIEAVRFQNQTGSPAAPAAGYSLLYLTTDGLYMETSGGAVIGPFVTGTAPAGGRTLIQELLPTGTTASFTSIPGTYKKLILEGAVRSTQAADQVTLKMAMNNDTTAGNYQYANHTANQFGDNATVGANYILTANVPAANVGASRFMHIIIELVQYANTGFYRTALFHSSAWSSASNYAQNVVGQLTWLNAANAVSQLDVSLSAGNCVVGSVFRLYGES